MPPTVNPTPLTPTTLTTDPHKYLHSTLYERRSDYLTPQHCRIKVGTWNVAALAVERDIKDWIRECEGEKLKPHNSYHAKHKRRASRKIVDLLEGAKEQLQTLDVNASTEKENWNAEGKVDLYVIALQEIVDVTAPENYLRPVDPKIPLNWKSHVQAALPNGYKLIASPQLIGVLLLVYASPRLQPFVSSVATSTVGTGLMGYMGNKGAAGVRIVIGETTRLVFIDCHLAALQNSVDRRNWDHGEVIRRMAFDKVKRDVLAGFPPDGNITAPVTEEKEYLDKADLIIWCGDLNYRVDLPNDEIRSALEPFMPQEFPPTIPSEGPSSPVSYKSPKAFTYPSISAVHDSIENMESTILKLLGHDQLYNQQKLEKAFTGYREGKITFLPTYKYDVGTTGVWDSSEKQRAPAYCDRILWKMKDEDATPPKKEDDTPKKDDISFVEIDTDGKNLAVPAPTHQDRPSRPRATTLTVEDEDGEDLIVSNNSAVIRHAPPPPEGEDDKQSETSFPKNTTLSSSSVSDLKLDLITYTSHQSVRASDHKPVTAVFSLKFPCVNDELKSEVYAEVAKEVDRIENERRPVVTIIVDQEEDPPSKLQDYRDEDMGISLGNVCLSQVVEKKLIIANTGLVPAKCLFKERPIIDEEFGEEKEAICKSWLHVAFDDEHSYNSKAIVEGVKLDPGEYVTVYLTVAIEAADVSLVQRLNDGEERLEDILVLHVEGGRDIFLPVSGKWMQSCFGHSLQELVSIPEGSGGARAFFAITAEGGEEDKKQEMLYSAPRELYRITEYLLHEVKSLVDEDLSKDEGIETRKWYSEVGWPFAKDTWGLLYDEDAGDDIDAPKGKRRKLLVNMQECLSKDEEFEFEEWSMEDGYTEEDFVEVAAECLLGFLGGLKKRVVPEELYEVVIKAGAVGTGGNKDAEKVLESLPTMASPVHANVFIYLTGFISEMISILSTPTDLPTIIVGITRSSTATSTSSTLTSPGDKASQIKVNTRNILLKQRLASIFAEVMIYRPLSPTTKDRVGKSGAGLGGLGGARDSVLSIVGVGGGGGGTVQLGGKKGDEEKRRAFLAHFLQF